MSVYSPPSRTVQEVITDVTRKFGDESGTELTTDDIVRWINDAMDTIVAQISILKARVKVTTTANQSAYSLEQYHIQDIDAIHYNGLRLPVMPWTEAQEKLFSIDDYADTTGEPVLWYAWESTLYLWPVPLADGELEIYYSSQATHVTNNPASIIPMPDKYYQTIVAYVLKQAHELGEDWNAAQVLQGQFDSQVSNFGEDDRIEQKGSYPTVQIVDDF